MDNFEPEEELEVDSIDEVTEPLSESTTEAIDAINDEADGKIDDTSPLYPYVCGSCKESNLTEPIHLSSCRECREQYCIHNASTIDPSKCTNCLSKVTMTEQTIEKKTEYYSEEKDKVFSKVQKARQISFKGEHWLFAARKIAAMNDDELLLGIEYHRAIYTAMLRERDQRKIDWFHRNAGKSFKINTSTGTSSLGTATTSETTVKKTKVYKPKTEKSLPEILKALIDAGYTNEQIVGMLGVK